MEIEVLQIIGSWVTGLGILIGTIIAVANKVLDALGVKKITLVDIFKKSKSYDDILAENIEIYDQLYTMLSEIREKYNLKNIQVVEFHNGTYINEKSIQFFSVTFEIARSIIDSTKSLYQKNPIAENFRFLKKYKDNKVVVIDQQEESNTDSGARMKIQGINKYLGVGLFNKISDHYPRAIISCALDENSIDDLESLRADLLTRVTNFKKLIFNTLHYSSLPAENTEE